jgi:hypothetical protein
MHCICSYGTGELIYVVVGSYKIMVLGFGVCRTDLFTNRNTKLILLWVTRSRSPELLFYQFSSQRVRSQCGTGAVVPHSGYCWEGGFVLLYSCNLLVIQGEHKNTP